MYYVLIFPIPEVVTISNSHSNSYSISLSLKSPSESVPAQDLQLVRPDAHAPEPPVRRPDGDLDDERLPDGGARPRPGHAPGRPQGVQAQPLQTHAGQAG